MQQPLVGEAANGREVTPDVVVMDLRTSDLDGIEATRQLTTGPEPARVLVLTTYDDDEYVFAALRAGASGVVVKDMALEDILGAIGVVADGDALIAPSVTRRLIEEFVGRGESTVVPAGSTSGPGPTPTPSSTLDK